jgi:hypothetical protein
MHGALSVVLFPCSAIGENTIVGHIVIKILKVASGYIVRNSLTVIDMHIS